MPVLHQHILQQTKYSSIHTSHDKLYSSEVYFWTDLSFDSIIISSKVYSVVENLPAENTHFGCKTGTVPWLAIPDCTYIMGISVLGAVWVMEHCTYQSRGTIARTELVCMLAEDNGGLGHGYWRGFFISWISQLRIPSVYTRFHILWGWEGTAHLHLLFVPLQQCSTKYLPANHINLECSLIWFNAYR